MYIILTYDIKQQRVGKILKICRKYLNHVQKSVFEGGITEAKLRLLEQEIKQSINMDEDMVCVYRMESVKYARKEEIGVVKNSSHII